MLNQIDQLFNMAATIKYLMVIVGMSHNTKTKKFQAEDAAIPRGDTEDTECYRKHGVEPPLPELPDPEKEALNCYNAASCDNNTDLVMVQPLPMLVQIT